MYAIKGSVDEELFMAYYLFWNFGFNVVVLLFSNAMSIYEGTD